MARLRLSVAIGDYDRNRPLFDHRVEIDGVDPIFMKLEPEEIFFRAFRNAEFDICELSHLVGVRRELAAAFQGTFTRRSRLSGITIDARVQADDCKSLRVVADRRAGERCGFAWRLRGEEARARAAAARARSGK
jgi:hypothetical protein